DLKVATGIRTAVCHWYNFNESETVTDRSEQVFGIHAGLVETSVMLAVKEAQVHMERARDFTNAASSWQDSYQRIGLAAGRARPGWVIGDLNPEGACGNAAAATRELGERLLNATGRNFAAFLAEFDRFCRDMDKV